MLETTVSHSNPYQAPTVAGRILAKQRDYSELDDKALKKLFYRSSNVNAIAALMLLGGVFTVSMYQGTWDSAEATDFPQETRRLMLLGVAVFQLIGFIGLASRTSWGKILGFVGCTLMLLNVLLGTIIGIVGLVALSKAPELFGPGRVTHKELKNEFKERKLRKKAEKREARLARKVA